MSKIVALLMCISTTVYAGFEQTDPGCRAHALGGCYVGLADDAWGIYFNPGGLSDLGCTEASFLYVPSQYGLSELRYAAGTVAVPTALGVAGIGFRSYGFSLYREFSGTCAWARELAGAGWGIALNYHYVAIANYGSASTLGVDAGVRLRLARHVTWGIAAKNINSPTIGSSGEPLPQSFSSGVVYSPITEIHLLADCEKQIGYEPCMKVGCEYWIVPQCALRVGMTQNPAQFSTGMGVRISNVQVDYALLEHEDLGWTQQASVTLRWGDLP